MTDRTTDENSLAKRPLSEIPLNYDTLSVLLQTPTVPVRYKESDSGVQDMYAATLYGRELGVGPMTSIYMLFLVNGQASMLGQLMLALVWKAGHKINVTIGETESTVHCFRRIDGEFVEVGDVTFSIEDAARANLLDKGTYEKFPRHMLTWRAVSMAARLYYPDVITGIGYIPDELGIEHTPEQLPEYVDVTGDLDLEKAHMIVDEIMEAEEVDG